MEPICFPPRITVITLDSLYIYFKAYPLWLITLPHSHDIFRLLRPQFSYSSLQAVSSCKMPFGAGGAMHHYMKDYGPRGQFETTPTSSKIRGSEIKSLLPFSLIPFSISNASLPAIVEATALLKLLMILMSNLSSKI